MIQFRCWYCNRRYSKSEQQVGQRLTCSCERLLRVPKRSGGYCRVKSAVDWLVEAIVYGGAGALLGFGLAVLFLSQGRGFAMSGLSWVLVAGLTLLGFLAGLLGGESGINWVGQLIRDRENR